MHLSSATQIHNSSSQQPTFMFYSENPSLRKEANIHQVTTMLATSKNVLFPGHNHLLTTGADDPMLWLLPKR